MDSVLPDAEGDAARLVAEILEYRGLRASVLSGPALMPPQQERLDVLEAQLRAESEQMPDGRAQMRAYKRFNCAFKARLRVVPESGDPVVSHVMVENVSAGGVKLAGGGALAAGDRVWLLVDSDDTVVAMPARVAWTGGGAAGLMFAGAPTWS